MNRFKKILAIACVAAVAAGSLAVFTACDDDKKGGSTNKSNVGKEVSAVPALPSEDLPDISADDAYKTAEALYNKAVYSSENVTIQHYSLRDRQYSYKSGTERETKSTTDQSSMKADLYTTDGDTYIDYYRAYGYETEASGNVNPNGYDKATFMNDKVHAGYRDGTAYVRVSHSDSYTEDKADDVLRSAYRDSGMDSLGEFSTAFRYDNVYYYISDLDMLFDYKNYLTDKDYMPRYGFEDADTIEGADLMNYNFTKKSVTKYSAVIKGDENSLFFDLDRVITLSGNGVKIVYEHRAVMYIDADAGYKAGDFGEFKLTNEEKALPGLAVDPKKVGEDFKAGKEIKINDYYELNHGGGAYGIIITEIYYPLFGYTTTMSTMYPINYTAEDGVLTVPAGEYAKLVETVREEIDKGYYVDLTLDDIDFALGIYFTEPDGSWQCTVVCR